jgi:hypothetical protein
MKNFAGIALLVSMAFIIYFFVREQFNGVILSRGENIFLSVLYVIVGVCVLILALIHLSRRKDG